MISSRPSVFALAILVLPACGGRPLSAVDGTLEPEPVTQPDIGVRADTRCVTPADLCHSSEECPADKVCSGCFSDPCGPTNECHGRCTALPQVCATNAECPTGAYCEHDGLCVVTGAKAGVCKKRPICPDTGAACFGVCGCDGKTYCSACEAHAAGVSVAVATKACLAPTCAELDQLYSAEIQKARSCCPMCASMQCTAKAVPLWCGCESPVNAISPMMTALEAEYIARGCALVMPPCGIKCGGSMPGYCSSSGMCTSGGD